MEGRSDGTDGRKPGTFLPGTSGNPNGRPVGSVSLRAMLMEQLEQTVGDKTYAQGIIEATLRDALKGDGQARRLVWEYIEGRPRDNLGEPVTHIVRIVDDV